MRLVISWLRDWVDVTASPQEIADTLALLEAHAPAILGDPEVALAALPASTATLERAQTAVLLTLTSPAGAIQK